MVFFIKKKEEAATVPSGGVGGRIGGIQSIKDRRSVESHISRDTGESPYTRHSPPHKTQIDR